MKELLCFKIDNQDTQAEYSVDFLVNTEHNNKRTIIEENLLDIDNCIHNVQDIINEYNADIDKLTNQADIIDNLLAVSSGVLCGFIDSFFVGEFNFEQLKADSNKHINQFIEKYAKITISTKTISRHIKLIESLTYRIIEKPPYVIPPPFLEKITFDIEPNKKFGHAAYPLMILTVLVLRRNSYDHRIRQKDIIRSIKFAFEETKLNRKTISRNIEVLIRLGYNITHTRKGYILENTD
jgi:hypothetical protein